MNKRQLNIMFSTLFIFLGICSVLAAVDRDCWVSFGDYQYILITEAGGVTFSKANNNCKEINATFLSIMSEEENIFVFDMLSKIVPIPVWIGLKRIGFYKFWMDKNKVTYIPEEYTIEQRIDACVCIMDHKWMETQCHSQLYFFCKRNVTDEGDVCPQDTTTQVQEPTTQHLMTTQGEEDHFIETQHKYPVNIEKIIEDLHIKKRPKHTAKEGPAGRAIGSIAILIMIAIIAGLVLLDLTTIQNHTKIFIRNLSDVWSKR